MNWCYWWKTEHIQYKNNSDFFENMRKLSLKAAALQYRMDFGQTNLLNYFTFSSCIWRKKAATYLGHWSIT